MNFLVQRGVFYDFSVCEHCGGRAGLQGKLARCTRNGCRKSTSILKHSFFAKSRLPAHDCLLLGYLWITGVSYSTALEMTPHSTDTICAYFSHFRQLVTSALDTEDTTIGGVNIVCQVDESKFGRRKNNRGSHREGAWVIGGIEQTEERKFFVEVVDRRDSETIVDVLGRHILPGSVVHTDCWRGYSGIVEAIDVSHETVNHSVGFIDHATGVHTNSIEGKWASLKRRITLRGRVRDKLGEYLFEQIWRHKSKCDLWAAFLNALRVVHYE